jgi:hypothetical protein
VQRIRRRLSETNRAAPLLPNRTITQYVYRGARVRAGLIPLFRVIDARPMIRAAFVHSVTIIAVIALQQY